MIIDQSNNNLNIISAWLVVWQFGLVIQHYFKMTSPQFAVIVT